MKRILAMLAAAALLSACRTEVAPAVRTLNPGYKRASSRVLVREIAVPTRANLDYAAWCGNMILLDTAKVEVHPAPVVPESLLAGGLFSDVETSIEATPLTDSEIAAPMAWKPVEDMWLAWSFDTAGALVTRVQEYSQRRWGDTSGAWLPFQQIVALHLHATAGGDEIWVRIEFAPWMAEHLDGIDDRDGDGFPEVWAKLAAPELKPSMVALLRGDYTRKVLSRVEAVQWANELAALWYPVYNTDMVDLVTENVFPQSSTESEVVKELGDLRIGEPLAVMRGRPFGTPLYLVLTIPTRDSGKGKVAAAAKEESRSVDTTLPARLDSIRARVASELSRHGGGWDAWIAATGSIRAKAASLEGSEPEQVQGIALKDGTLLFRRELSYLGADDLAKLPEAGSPVRRIKALKDSLAGLGVDFLFVPVPTKLDVEPTLVGGIKGDVVQPWSRKLLADLADAGVETVDLLPALRGKGLWRRQDTHWKPSGAEAAADVLARRIREYGWFGEVSHDSLILARKDTVWSDFGDLRDRLAPASKAKAGQEKVAGARFFGPDGKPWDDSEKGPILLLGDSYLGVYQKITPRAAGFSSLLAADLKVPVTVTMGWGGGPEAPKKLAARGPEGLRGKRLVVWVMSQRDLFRYPGGWAQGR